MITGRELTLDDYLAMLRRRIWVLLIPVVLAPLIGWLVSYLLTAKYTSQSLIMVEGQKVPTSMVQPVVTADLTQRIATLQQRVLSDSALKPVVERLNLAKGGQNVDEMVDTIRANMSIQPVITDLSQIGDTTGKARKPNQSPVPGFYLNYTAPNAREAQQICNELTSLLLSENLKSRQDVAKGTTDLLSKGLEDAKRTLDDLDTKLAAFKKQYVGQLPGDEDNNFKILTGLNSQLDANTQTLNRAQQDKAYTESLLAQQMAAWKSSQSTSNPETLQKQLSDLQSQLLQLQAKYTSDHPDVIKAKADIAEVQKRLAEVNKASAAGGDDSNEKASANEPPEIRQLRMQIHQYSDMIGAATRDQKRLQQEISLYQGRVALSPAIEEQYKQLARNYDNAQKNYQDILADKSKSDLALTMEQQQQGEFMHLMNPANLPDAPSFPNRLLFAGGGLGAGLVLGLAIALWMELRDKAIRTEADAEAAMDLPMLVAVPWVGESAHSSKNGYGRFWKRSKKPDKKETVAV
ncbi:MAG TPA: Wzz/FepE/Etk N-terminal domain-containing protein [Candidatus Sulfotelmatobacter sp.]